MENFLNAMKATKECFEKNNFNDLMTKDNLEIKHLCFNERKELISQIMSDNLKTTNLIPERIIILQERQQNLFDQRRKFLDGFIPKY